MRATLRAVRDDDEIAFARGGDSIDAPPVTPVEAARTLWQIGAAIDAETGELIALRRQYAQRLREHRETYARVFLSATGTVEDRKRIAERDSIQEWMAVQGLEQQMAVCQDKLRALRDRSEIGRVINANLKEELRTTGLGAGA